MARELVKVAGQQVQNKIINGNFDFWQRGTSGAVGAGVVTYTADRFSAVKTFGTGTQSRSTDVPTQAQSGFRSVYSWLVTNGTGVSPTAGDLYVAPQIRVEGQDYQALHGKTARLQFWVKSSLTGTYSVCFQNGANNRSYVTTYTVLLANTWEKKTIDIAMDTTGTWNFNNLNGLSIQWVLSAGTTFQTPTLNTWQAANVIFATGGTNWVGTTGATFQLAQVMLTSGEYGADNSLVFQRAGKTIEDELALCQRYYVNSNDVTATGANFAASAGAYVNCALPVRMRANPTAFISDAIAVPAPITSNSNITGVSPNAYVISGLNNTGAARGYAYTADAEL